MVDPLLVVFPSLGQYQTTSPASDHYNCIAWAAGDTAQWWWPDEGEGICWPHGVPQEETLTAFQAVFASLGYSVCHDAGWERGIEKIALFADENGLPTHAARQLPTGCWTSKLGRAEDIEHDLHHLEGTEYGKVVVLMNAPPRHLPDNVKWGRLARALC